MEIWFAKWYFWHIGKMVYSALQFVFRFCDFVGQIAVIQSRYWIRIAIVFRSLLDFVSLRFYYRCCAAFLLRTFRTSLSHRFVFRFTFVIPPHNPFIRIAIMFVVTLLRVFVLRVLPSFTFGSSPQSYSLPSIFFCILVWCSLLCLLVCSLLSAVVCYGLLSGLVMYPLYGVATVTFDMICIDFPP